MTKMSRLGAMLQQIIVVCNKIVVIPSCVVFVTQLVTVDMCIFTNQ